MSDVWSESTQQTPVASVTVAELDTLVKEIFEKRREIEEQDSKVTALNKELALLKAKAVTYLKELGRESYPTPFGTVSVSQKWRVNMPKTDDDKAALFAYLKDKGVYDHYATVNSNELNAFYMKEWEAAKKNGDGVTFAMPGIEPPKLFEDLGMRKK